MKTVRRRRRNEQLRHRRYRPDIAPFSLSLVATSVRWCRC
uniref:Uncharacterized protein n=1 Tax=Hyaloperonospora parasitica TaxID=123356 RepID=A2T2J9_9STRA|nr:unknown [Hyaloperonospora parasitica]